MAWRAKPKLWGLTKCRRALWSHFLPSFRQPNTRHRPPYGTTVSKIGISFMCSHNSYVPTSLCFSRLSASADLCFSRLHVPQSSMVLTVLCSSKLYGSNDSIFLKALWFSRLCTPSALWVSRLYAPTALWFSRLHFPMALWVPRVYVPTAPSSDSYSYAPTVLCFSLIYAALFLTVLCSHGPMFPKTIIMVPTAPSSHKHMPS